jgi:hypothetical protein
MNRHPFLISFVAVLTLIGSVWFTWQRHFRAPDFPVPLHEAVGTVLATELQRELQRPGEVLVLTLDDDASPILATQLAALRATLAKSPHLRIGKVVTLESDKKGKYGPGTGLSSSKLAREIGKFPQAIAVVSLVGLPSLDDTELQAMGNVRPPLFGVCRDRRKLETLARHQWLRSAIVPRFEFPAPGPEDPKLPRERFDRQFQIVTAPEPPASASR